MEAEGALQVLKAQAPARELHRYATTLQALTGGHAMHAEEFSHYEQMPRELEEKVIKESAAARAERANGH
jgi:elongation factor G